MVIPYVNVFPRNREPKPKHLLADDAELFAEGRTGLSGKYLASGRDAVAERCEPLCGAKRKGKVRSQTNME